MDNLFHERHESPSGLSIVVDSGTMVKLISSSQLKINSLKEAQVEVIILQQMIGSKEQEVVSLLQQLESGVKEVLKMDIGLSQQDNGSRVVKQDTVIHRHNNGLMSRLKHADTSHNLDHGFSQQEVTILVVDNGLKVVEEVIMKAKAIGLLPGLLLQKQ